MTAPIPQDTESAATLLPCPFCGEDHAYTRIVGGGYQIVCNICRVHTSAASNADAIAAWNRRTAPATLAAAQAMLRALVKAAQELNAIRARDGAPQHIDWYKGRPIQTDSCTHEYWDSLTEECFAAIEAARAAGIQEK